MSVPPSAGHPATFRQNAKSLPHPPSGGKGDLGKGLRTEDKGEIGEDKG